MGSDFKDLFLKHHIVTLDQVQRVEQEQQETEQHVFIQKEIKHNISFLERTFGYNKFINRFGQRVSYLRWYSALKQPIKIHGLCFFCGIEGIDAYTANYAVNSIELSAALLGLSAFDKEVEIAEIRYQELHEANEYLQMLPDEVEAIKDFFHGTAFQVCGACKSLAIFKNVLK